MHTRIVDYLCHNLRFSDHSNRTVGSIDWRGLVLNLFQSIVRMHPLIHQKVTQTGDVITTMQKRLSHLSEVRSEL
jgi:hypothetical protein